MLAYLVQTDKTGRTIQSFALLFAAPEAMAETNDALIDHMWPKVRNNERTGGNSTIGLYGYRYEWAPGMVALPPLTGGRPVPGDYDSLRLARGLVFRKSWT